MLFHPGQVEADMEPLHNGFVDLHLQNTEDGIQLTDYGVQARYPFKLELNESDTMLAIKNAERIQAFVQARTEGLQ